MSGFHHTHSNGGHTNDKSHSLAKENVGLINARVYHMAKLSLQLNINVANTDKLLIDVDK